MVNSPRLLEQVRDSIRARHMSFRTEKTYLYWIRRFIRFHKLRHPREMGGTEVEMFLTSLAVDDKARDRHAALMSSAATPMVEAAKPSAKKAPAKKAAAKKAAAKTPAAKTPAAKK